MDMIYSRPRIKIPNFYYGKRGKNSGKKIAKTLVIIGIAILVMFNILSAIDPIFVNVCKDKAKSMATIEINKITTNNIFKYQDEFIEAIDFIKREKYDIMLKNVV